MSEKNLGSLEVICDAPPYPIVQACNAIGLETPEDVAWQHMPVEEPGEGAEAWQKLLHPTPQVCSCKSDLPRLAKYRFTYSSGDEVTYSVGQCQTCRKVYWTEG